MKASATNQQITRRLKLSIGHLTKIIDMVEHNENCMAILRQSQAIQKALKETDNLIMERHLHECTALDTRTGRESDALREVLTGFKKKSTI